MWQLWLIIASFLASFNLGKARDELNNEIEIDGTIIELGVVMFVFQKIIEKDRFTNVVLQPQEGV